MPTAQHEGDKCDEVKLAPAQHGMAVRKHEAKGLGSRHRWV